MTQAPIRNSRTVRALTPMAAIALAILAGCAERAPSNTTQTTQSLDGNWEFEFDSATSVGTDGMRCLDGIGQMTIEEGRIVGTTFSEFAGVMQSRGGLEGGISENADGALISFASSQSGKNTFFAIIRQTSPGMSGTWKDIHDCKGTFTAVRA